MFKKKKCCTVLGARARRNQSSQLLRKEAFPAPRVGSLAEEEAGPDCCSAVQGGRVPAELELQLHSFAFASGRLLAPRSRGALAEQA